TTTRRPERVAPTSGSPPPRPAAGRGRGTSGSAPRSRMPRAGRERAGCAARARRTHPRPQRERPTPRRGWRTGGPSVELAPRDLDATIALDLARSADERGGEPPREP